MPTRTRAVRAARRLLAKESIRSPAVPVEELASRFAYVIREKLPREVSGMLVPLPTGSAQREWVIVVNAANALVRQRFTIAHELGHALLHRFAAPHADTSFKVRFRDATSSKGNTREEIEANQFAAELLMPAHLLLTELERIQGEITFDYVEEMDAKATKLLAKLARKFEVSVQALSFRIANLAQSVL